MLWMWDVSFKLIYCVNENFIKQMLNRLRTLYIQKVIVA